MRGRLQCYMWMGLGWMDGMVIIGHRSSKSTFGTNNFLWYVLKMSINIIILIISISFSSQLRHTYLPFWSKMKGKPRPIEIDNQIKTSAFQGHSVQWIANIPLCLSDQRPKVWYFRSFTIVCYKEKQSPPCFLLHTPPIWCSLYP